MRFYAPFRQSRYLGGRRSDEEFSVADADQYQSVLWRDNEGLSKFQAPRAAFQQGAALQIAQQVKEAE
jgi:hypothetical protein